jgi:hypothetical protein
MREFEYINRKGVSYYLHARSARDGTTRYTLKRTKDGALAELPAGYEVVESVNGQASVRRARARHISPVEEAIVSYGLTRHELTAYRLEIKGLDITVFEPDRDPAAIAAEFNPLEMMPAEISERVKAMVRERFGDEAVDQYINERQAEVRQQIEYTVRYAPVLRFKLVDRRNRAFEVARMTYRGEGGWHALDVLPLAAAVAKYVKHLGRDSFFELI